MGHVDPDRCKCCQNHFLKYVNVVACSRQYANFMAFSKQYANVVACSRQYSNIVACSRQNANVVACLRLIWHDIKYAISEIIQETNIVSYKIQNASAF